MTDNRSEEDERRHLAATVSRIRQALEATETLIRTARSDIIAAKQYVWTNRDQLDPAERAANAVDISLSVDHGEKAVAKRDRLEKLALSPYFGRVDFSADDRPETQAYYIGVHAFGEGEDNLVYDWRSPVASLFYDYNVGRARYEAVDGAVEGTIGLKRQYRVHQGTMAYMIESAMRIGDDILQKELSRTSDDKMKHIAATIQKEQNAVIRNERAQTLIIQGAAGSGKTSVALHRVAYLLYKHKGTLTSANILILSPNKVFSDFIANVLPELGEEKIAETGFEAIAAAELAGVCGFQTFNEQVSELSDGAEDEDLIERVRRKADMPFVRSLDEFIAYASEHYFEAAAIIFPDVEIGQSLIEEVYRASAGLPVKLRLAKTASIIAGQARTAHGDRLSASAAKRVQTAVRRMFKEHNVLKLYQAYYAYAGRKALFKPRTRKTVEWSDVYPLLYLKIRLEGSKGYEATKHLIVDEMQDYTAVQYAVLSLLFPCRKTILGDGSQSVNPYSSSTAARIKEVFPDAETVELRKSYRSTIEIIDFARRIGRNSRIVPIERHGERPVVVRAANEADEWRRIGGLIAAFRASERRSLGIVCKTQAQANRLHGALSKHDSRIHMLDFGSEAFREGVVVTSAHMAKGLEFDEVVVPSADAANFRTEMDRSLLYIACTRALHKLALTCHGAPSAFLPDGRSSRAGRSAPLKSFE